MSDSTSNAQPALVDGRAFAGEEVNGGDCSKHEVEGADADAKGEGLKATASLHDSGNSRLDEGQQQSQQHPTVPTAEDTVSREVQVAIARNHQAATANHALGSSGNGYNAILPMLDTAMAAPTHPPLAQRNPNHLSPAQAGLHLNTAIESPSTLGPARVKETPTLYGTPDSTKPGLHTGLTSPLLVGGLGSSLQSNLSTTSMTSSLSPGSTLASPYLAAMTDLTPLPSPLVGSDVPSAFRRPQPRTPNRSRAGTMEEDHTDGRTRTSNSPSSQASPPGKKKKGYGSLMAEATLANAAAHQDNAQQTTTGRAHIRERSLSEFVPEQLSNVRQRHLTIGPGDAPNIEAQEYHMQREAYLAAQRGLTLPASLHEKQLPSPPPSNSSVAESDDPESEEQPYLEDGTLSEYLEIQHGIHNKPRKFRQLRKLGQGTFSTVMLATGERLPSHITPEIEDSLDPHKLVAIKIVEHGPAGGVDEQRIETSLKREVEMLRLVSHPSLIHLKACEYQPSRALLVLTYCPGGDLFELASQKRDVLTPSMVQRMFAELIGAVRYLHQHSIVHRDIKLENVLVNIPNEQLKAITDPAEHPTPIVTLTDLGLSRRVPQPPESPLLTTRCGSEDYAAPEILLGQPYDGRQTDAWALGVLLYALMEGRLPFDAPPGKPDRSRNTHRIARCDWIWCRFGDENGEWDAVRAQSFAGANQVVEGLLKKVRMGRKSLEDTQSLPWVQEGIKVEGGLKMREEDEGEGML